jgi:hypothetical protein
MFLVIIFSLLFLISILPFSIYICSLRILQFEEANTMSITRCKKNVIFLWSCFRKKVKDHDAILNAVECYVLIFLFPSIYLFIYFTFCLEKKWKCLWL